MACRSVHAVNNRFSRGMLNLFFFEWLRLTCIFLYLDNIQAIINHLENNFVQVCFFFNSLCLHGLKQGKVKAFQDNDNRKNFCDS